MKNHRLKRKKNINFLLESNHYRRLHLILYLSTIAVILTIYYTLVFLFSESGFTKTIMVVISFGIGLFLVFKRDEWVKRISDYFEEKKRQKRKAENKEGKKTTLRTITPKNKNLKLNIHNKLPWSQRISDYKKKFKKTDNKKPQKEYIEIED